ncbi:M48 family metalloprotease [Massilia sp. CCM 8695]|uniref:M48 family metalloprotease n=1 Tax=Massilia frigida TaxID=2609281 RepID=A0ABX0N3I8_9BURK|nr:M48 family metallopeptidase [Massilia frigida]NHZ77846.1 M48 family metalloprotease [Massilia frigida]
MSFKIECFASLHRPQRQETAINAPINAPSPELAARLTAPSRAYKNSARLAVAGLLLFVALYCGLAGWFMYTPWQVFVDGAGSDLGIFAYIMAACSLFIGVLMLKAIFSVRNAKFEDLHEVTASEQPRLFAYLFELADAAGAPRPHKVFLSARVNAAVFYDLSLFNLIFPSKKNLEIGLPLVNTLSRGELRAVLAHEFGHFAQRSMAVGRWVYVAQQIAGHMVTRRDKFDEFLAGVGRIDFRLAMAVGVLQVIIWSIRSLVDSVFRVVVMQRALSREMEMQADLVAVSLTGSDALIHALHRTRGADDVWARALSFIHREHATGRTTRDAFTVQTHLLQRMSSILNDRTYAEVPPLPEQGREAHRVFKAELAQPSKMWRTHPLNHEREANAKRIYVAAPIDPASAWTIFEQPSALREQMTRSLLGDSRSTPVDLEESLKTLALPFQREQYNRRYCGVYFGRPLTRHASALSQLRDGHYAAAPDTLASLYPATLTDDVQLLRTLQDERGQLDALIAGHLTAPGGVVRLRGEEFSKKQLPAALERVRAEIEEVNARLHRHDWLCRSWHQNMARQLGGGWEAYLDGLLALVHYAEHRLADMHDAQGMLNNAAAVVTAVRRVTADGVARVVRQGAELYNVMDQIHRESAFVHIDPRFGQRLGLKTDWRRALGGYSMAPPHAENINEFMRDSEAWSNALSGWLDMLHADALEELLVTETMVVRCSRGDEAMVAAPLPSQVPPSYPLLLVGAERKRQQELDWWARFQRADGAVPGGARLLVAASIVIAVLSAGSFTKGGVSAFGSDPVITVYNGLGAPVNVNIDGKLMGVPAHAHRELSVPMLGKHHVETRSADGRPIEIFDAVSQRGGHPVYNVASAAPLVRWVATYGHANPVPETVLGAPRWIDTDVDFLFAKPPQSISGKGGRSARSVLDGMADAAPQAQLALLTDEAQAKHLGMMHARWDDLATVDAETWLAYARRFPEFGSVLEERLKNAPRDVLLRRIDMDEASAARKPALCAELAAQSAAQLDDGDLRYLALRCRDKGAIVKREMAQARERWPGNAWLARWSAFDKMQAKDFAGAVPALEQLVRTVPAMADDAAINLARVRRMLDPGADLAELENKSRRLQYLLEVEKGAQAEDSPLRAYRVLSTGRLNEASDMPALDPARAMHILRLAAASDGADAGLIKRAMALPFGQDMDAGTIWVGLALATRHGYDAGPYREATRTVAGPYQEKMLAFFDSIAAGQDPRVAERRLETGDPEALAQVYSAGLVLLGEKAPAEWRVAVKRLLFISERPYFKA